MTFTPLEYADTFMKLYTMNVTEGVFITSGVCGDADQTTRQMLDAMRILRYQRNFMGYIHFKILPGVSYTYIKEALELADRVSVNVEAPTKAHLSEIAGQKDYDNDILLRQRWIKEARIQKNHDALKALQDYQADYPMRCVDNAQKADGSKNPTKIQFLPRMREEWMDEFGQVRLKSGYLKKRWDDAPILTSGQTTQFILGAAGESDWDVLKRLDWEYREMDLRRGYFSAFNPVMGTPLEERPATPAAREHRLYQTDWLLRNYHMTLPDIKSILNANENLPSGDPKVHIARVYFGAEGRLDVNVADYDELLRVPGIGPLSAKRILDLRKNHVLIESRRQLHQIGVVLKRADPFLSINGHHQRRLDAYVSEAD